MPERVNIYRKLLQKKSLEKRDKPEKPVTNTGSLDLELAALALEMDASEIQSAWGAAEPKNTSRGVVDVLLIEDDRAMIDLVRAVLAPDRICLSVAASCSEAVSSIRENQPRLLLVDLGLPDGSGLDVVRHVRAWHDFRHIPIIALTASAEKAGEAWKAGFTGFIAKPFEPAVFRTMVGSWLSLFN